MHSSLAMACVTPISPSRTLFKKPQLAILRKPQAHFLSLPVSSFSLKKSRMVAVSATMAWKDAATMATEKPEKGSFVEEMRFAAMRLHSRDEAKEGEREPDGPPIAKWEISLEGYLKFLADSRLLYETLERIVEKAAFPEYAEFRNTGLERSERLERDVEWFKQQGHAIPKPSSLGIKYAKYLEKLSEKDPQAFVCHFYMTYFGHTAGGRMIGRKVEKRILNGTQLEFYKYDGDLSQLLRNVRDKLNRVAESWSREEKDHCLEETEKSFKFAGDILRLVLS